MSAQENTGGRGLRRLGGEGRPEQLARQSQHLGRCVEREAVQPLGLVLGHKNAFQRELGLDGFFEQVGPLDAGQRCWRGKSASQLLEARILFTLDGANRNSLHHSLS